MNRDNTPTFNVNRKVVNFKDFLANPNAEKEELKKMDRQNKPNSDDQQKNMANTRYKFNNITRKIDDLSPAEVKDKFDAIIEAIDELNESLFSKNKGLKKAMTFANRWVEVGKKQGTETEKEEERKKIKEEAIESGISDDELTKAIGDVYDTKW